MQYDYSHVLHTSMIVCNLMGYQIKKIITEKQLLWYFRLAKEVVF